MVERVRGVEVTGALSLATDLQLGLDLEHSLRSSVFAVRLAEALGVARADLADTFHTSLLMYVGCTADIHVRAELFDDVELAAQNLFPVMYGSQRELLSGMMRSVEPGSPPAKRAAGIVRTLPRAARVMPVVDVACREVAGMLSDRLGLPASVQTLAPTIDERWDGKGEPGLLSGEEIPLPTRIAHVARDADLQLSLGGVTHARSVLRVRSGNAFDPEIAALAAEDAEELFALDPERSVWDEALECEPGPPLMLEGDEIDEGLAAMGDFADLVSPYLSGHSGGVAELAGSAAEGAGLGPAEVSLIRRAALVHDIGRTAVPTAIWQLTRPLTAQEWERVRLHPYHSERILSRSSFLTSLAPVACAHHERCDGSGYHRGADAASLSVPARVLAAADALHAMTEPRPHRAALSPEQAENTLVEEARGGRLDPDAVVAVLEALGRRPPKLERPGGLTQREAEVIGLLARGLQTKQVAQHLEISVKTADRHIQNAYGKIGVSTRAGATVFAMQKGLIH